MLETDDEQYYREEATYTNTLALSQREIEYLETKPRPIDVQIPLWEYFERVKRHKADRWQKDFCDRLEKGAVDRQTGRIWEIYHAEGQLGKTSILSQAFQAWLFGHDALFRSALAMYNVSRSQTHSKVVIQIMQSNVHKDIFPDKDGWIHDKSQSVEGWMTNARREINDGQLSFNPVGLQSGLTGSGFDWLFIDDPYKESKEAFSETVRENMANFWNYTVLSRVSLYSNVTGMFHRYAPEDFAGFLLDTGDFDYIRYASEADGDYVHEQTGKVYPDPLNRAPGELISPERRPAEYYAKTRKNRYVWLSMFQGRPSSEEGEFFNVGRIKIIPKELEETRLQECVSVVRSYDSASTDEAGAYSVGVKMGIRPNGHVTIFNLWRKRVDTAKRLQAIKTLARIDGADVTITVPNDPGGAGTDVVWFTQQRLNDYTVIGRPTSGSKEDRAENFSVAVNSGEVEFVDDSDLRDELADLDTENANEKITIDKVITKWIKEARKELRDFPRSEYKDIVDACSDAYNYNYEIFRKGMIVKNYRPQRNLASREKFIERFPFRRGDAELFKIPKKWEIYAGVKLNLDASRASSAVIAARASVNSGLSETLFVIGEYKAYDADFYKLFTWIDDTLDKYCLKSDCTIWAHPDSESALQTVNQKLKHRVVLFNEDEFAGMTELNWYLLPKESAHPFNFGEQSAGLYFLVPENQFAAAEKPAKAQESFGFYHARQEIKTWGYDEKGNPTKIGQVLDCLRMITFKFRTYEEPLTIQEEFDELIGDVLPEKRADGSFDMTMQKQQEIQFRQFLAADTLIERHGEDVFEQAAEYSAEPDGQCELCYQYFLPGDSIERDEHFGDVHRLCLAEKRSADKSGAKWW